MGVSKEQQAFLEAVLGNTTPMLNSFEWGATPFIDSSSKPFFSNSGTPQATPGAAAS